MAMKKGFLLTTSPGIKAPRAKVGSVVAGSKSLSKPPGPASSCPGVGGSNGDDGDGNDGRQVQRKSTMKKGFLLSSSSSPSTKSKSSPNRSKIRRQDSSKEKRKINSRNEPKAKPKVGGSGIRRGFLLANSSPKSSTDADADADADAYANDINKTQTRIENADGLQTTLPQCRQETNKSHDHDRVVVVNSKSVLESTTSTTQSMRSKKRVTTTSTALLDFEESSQEHDISGSGNASGNAENEKNRQSQPIASSLFRVIGDDTSDSNNKDASNNGNENDYLIRGEYQDNNNPSSLDSWIIQPSSSSSGSQTQTLVLPNKSKSSADDRSGKKSLIVEVERPSTSMMIQEEVVTKKSSTITTTHSPKASKKIPDFCLDEPTPQADSPNNRVGTKRIETSFQKIPHAKDDDQPTPQPPLSNNRADDDDDDDTTTANSLRFANSVSLLLAQLRHSMKPKKNGTSSEQDYLATTTIGFGRLIINNNKQSASVIKNFVTKHFHFGGGTSTNGGQQDVNDLECIQHQQQKQLDELWKIILEPIAQDYSERVQSLKKKKNRSKTLKAAPSSLALGLGVFEFINQPTGVAYESLTKVLSGAASANKSSNIPHIQGRGTMPDPDLEFQERRNKLLKIMVFGAVYLVRCRVHCIAVSITSLENGTGTSLHDNIEGMRAMLGDIQSELEILLSTVLPALESIVGSDASDGRTMLTSAAADACFELIETSSRAVVLRYMINVSNVPGSKERRDKNPLPPKSMQVWRSILPLIERLMAVKKRWVSRAEKSNSCKSDPSRVTCVIAVLDDWFDVVKSSKRLFFDHFVGDDSHEQGADVTAGLNLFWNLSGISFRREENAGSSTNSCYRVGGMAQSLCSTSIHEMSCFNSFGSAEAEDLVLLIKGSAKLTDSIRTASKSGRLSEAWTKENHQRAAIRAFASWLSRGSKAVRILTKNNQSQGDAVALLDSALESLLVLLRLDSKRCVDMSIATLSMLWPVSPDWASQEVSSDKTSEPKYFLDLLSALHMHSLQPSSDENGKQPTQQAIDGQVDPTSRALCVIVARVALQRPAYLFPFVMKMKGRVEIMIEVVLNMLEQLPNTQPSKINLESDNPNTIVYQGASKMLLQNIGQVSYLRSRIRSNPSLFTNVPCDMIIPQVVHYLVKNYAERKSLASVSSLSGLLCNILKANTASGHADDFVRCIMTCLHDIEEKEFSGQPSAAEDKTQIANFFNKNGSLWRMMLMEGSTSADSAYKDVLLATAKSMIEMPSSSTPLTLLASLVDGQFHQTPASQEVIDHSEKRISIATSAVIHFAMHQSSLSRKNATVDEKTIFGRLAPLLILRRIPRSYYRAVHKALANEDETREIVVDLTAFLSRSLQSHAQKNEQSNLVKEEKKLLAELAGHCLPFSSKITRGKLSLSVANESPVSLFENVCRRPFSDTLIALRGDPDTAQWDKIHSIYEAKTALYAASHSVPLALDEDDGESLLNVASFVFEVLNYQPGLVIGTKARMDLFQKEIAMLQSGCTHFLAVSMDSMSSRKAATAESTRPAPLIEDLDCSGTSNKIESTNKTILEALSALFHMLLSIITTGEIGYEALYHDFYSFLRNGTKENHKPIQFTPASRMSMLNSIIMLSQGSQAEDNRLDWLASNTLPILVEWAGKGPMDDGVRHPLCVAAVLQVIYTLLARCGSFAWLSIYSNKGLSHQSETDFVCQTLQCALKSFHTSEGDGPTVNMLRLTAMKVILTVIALNQANELESEQGLKGYLSPIEIRQAMSALHGAANVDQNPEVRRLANQIIPYLQTV